MIGVLLLVASFAVSCCFQLWKIYIDFNTPIAGTRIDYEYNFRDLEEGEELVVEDAEKRIGYINNVAPHKIMPQSAGFCVWREIGRRKADDYMTLFDSEEDSIIAHRDDLSYTKTREFQKNFTFYEIVFDHSNDSYVSRNALLIWKTSILERFVAQSITESAMRLIYFSLFLPIVVIINYLKSLELFPAFRNVIISFLVISISHIYAGTYGVVKIILDLIAFFIGIPRMILFSFLW